MKQCYWASFFELLGVEARQISCNDETFWGSEFRNFIIKCLEKGIVPKPLGLGLFHGDDEIVNLN